MDKKFVVTGVFLVVLLAGYFTAKSLYQQDTQKEYRFLATKQAELFVRDHSPRLGKEDAPVYLVEFLDPECESCRAFYPHVKRILDQVPDVQLVVRYAPFHGNSEFAVKLLEASRMQGKYWQALEAFFARQPEWGDHHHPRPELLWGILEGVGVDVEKVRKDMHEPSIAKIIEQDKKDLKELNVRRTPTFFVNGVPLMDFGYQPLLDLVKAEREKAVATR